MSTEVKIQHRPCVGILSMTVQADGKQTDEQSRAVVMKM